MQLSMPIFNQHTCIFSIRAFSAPPTDGQLLFSFFKAALLKPAKPICPIVLPNLFELCLGRKNNLSCLSCCLVWHTLGPQHKHRKKGGNIHEHILWNKAWLKAFALPPSNSKRPSTGPASPPGQSGALFAANVYAENTWTEFELPYDVGLFLALMSYWQQRLHRLIVSTKRSNTQFGASVTPTSPQPPSYLSLSLYV